MTMRSDGNRAKRTAALLCAVLFLVFMAGCSAGTAGGSTTGAGTAGTADGSTDGVLSGSDAAAPSSGLDPLHVEDGQLTDSAGCPVQLRGVSTHGIYWFSQYTNARAFSYIKEEGGNVVRIAMYTGTDDGYCAKPEENMKLVRQAIENALAFGLYVIVDWHILDDGNPNEHRDEAITFFDAVASAYPGEPGIIYEICNEPNGVSWEAVKEHAYAMIHVIRQYSPEAVILIGTPEYSAHLSPAMEDPVGAENLMYTWHFYAGERYSYDTLKKAVEEHFPVFVSEWGIGYKGDGEPALKQGEEFARYLNEHGISWCAWSFSNKDEIYSILRADCGKWSGFTNEDLTEPGRVIMDALSNG